MLWSGSDRLENWTVARPRGGRSSSGRGRPERRRRVLRLVVESLEDRTVLTTMLMVSSLLDDGTAGTLRAVIGQANSGVDSEYVIGFGPAVTGTITLTQGELALANSNAAVAEKAITIDGPGASQLAVSGNNVSRVFEIRSGVTATLAGLTITGGQAVSGGGIYNNNGGTVTVTASTLSGNSATNSGGGGIYNHFGGTVTVTASTLSDNAANAGGGIYNFGGTVIVTDSTLSDNAAGAGGGILNDDGTVTVTASTLSGNSANGGDGGGIYNHFGGTVTVTASTLSGNSATNSGGRGGGIYNIGGTVTVADSTLSDNAATNDGGGIYNNSGGTVTVTASTLSGNSATSSGGGIFNVDSTVTVAASTLSGNSATEDGGGIHNTLGGTVTVTASTLSGNSATNFGGGIYNYGTLTVTDSTQSDNSATKIGGGIYNLGGTVSVTTSTLSGNSAITGGGIYNHIDGRLMVTACTLSGNSADSGGGIYNYGSGTVAVTASTLSDNSATNFGGGIYNNKEDGTVTVTASTLSGNSARVGGGIYNIFGRATVTDSTLSGNSVTDSGIFGGGGIYNFAGKVTVTHSTLSGNSSTTYGGGGIYNNTGTVTVTASTLSGNSTKVLGGGIYNSVGTVTVSASTVSGNSTDTYGGGIYNSGGTVALTDSTLSDNSATYLGGGIYNDIGGMVAVSASILSGNSATRDGGAIWNSGTVTVTDSGGVTHIKPGGTVTLSNSTLSGNSATRDGGGIYNKPGGMVTVSASTLSGNSATNFGGGIFNNSVGTVTLTNAIVAGNQGPSGPDLYGVASSQGHNLIGDTTGSSGWVTSDLTGTAAAPLDPLLGPLQDNGGPTRTMALLPGSPAIDAGAAVPGLTTDQRGIARPQGSAPDIGAFESRGFDFVIAGGGNQSTAVGQSFAQPLVVRVSSRFGEPVDGGVVGFTAPGSGPSTAPPTGSATISQGRASLSAVANTQAGSYVVTASASGASQSGSFRLTNTPGVPIQVTATSGTPQTATVVTDFTQPLGVRVTDQYGNPVPGVAVTFAAPGTGPSASFDGATTFTATTDAAGLATARASANTEAGQYVVTAAVAGLAPPVLVVMTNAPTIVTNAPTIVPRVVGLQRLGFRRRPTRLVLSFNEGLDPSRASDPRNYALFHSGRDGRLGTRDDRSLGLGRVVYDPAGPIVTLRPNRLLNLRRRYTLVVRGTLPGGLADPAGGFLAGAGRPGTDYVTTFGGEIPSRPGPRSFRIQRRPSGGGRLAAGQSTTPPCRAARG